MIAHTVGELKAKLDELDDSMPIRTEITNCSGRELRPVRVSKVKRNITEGTYMYPGDETFNTILLEF